MCGISAIISRTGQPVNPYALKAMNDSLRHRGPDDAGYAFLTPSPYGDGRGSGYAVFTDPEFRHRNQHIAPFGGSLFQSQLGRMNYSVGLAHRRLSIIDLAPTGHQPMQTMNNRFWIVYNGEIYNHFELRTSLEKRGRVFQGTSDTEVLLQLWEEFGEDCIHMLNGMFAALVIDLETGKTFLFRDRYGIKPVYYALSDEYFIVGSEPKAILHSCLLNAQIDQSAMCEYFTFQNIFSNRTLFNGIKLLEPGSILVTQAGSRDLPTLRQYYDRQASAVDLSGQSFKDICTRVADVFEGCIRRQLVSDVEVGAYLSGGMDSGSIVSASCNHIPRMHTFTCGFDLSNVLGIEQGFDERKESEALSYLLQTEHYEVVLHSGDMQAAMEELTWHVDDLRVGMCHQNWYAAKLASKFVKVCLSGTGGDEVFAGYPWRYEKCFQWQQADSFGDEYFSYWHRLLPKDELGALFASGMEKYLPAARKSFFCALERSQEKHTRNSANEALLRQVMNFEFDTFLHGLLTIEDKISMAHSMEVRVPFLDNELVDLAAGIPPGFNLQLDEAKVNGNAFPFLTSDGKRVLRCAMKRYLPSTYTQKPKQGFSPPDENWYRGPTMEYIKSILLDKQTTDRPWFNARVVEEKLQDHFDGRCNRRLLIWSLLVFEWLQRHYVDKTYSL